MRTNKSKLVIIVSAIVIIAVAIIIGLILFLTTDMFKGNQEMFFKYAIQNSEILEIIGNNNNYSEALGQSKYTTNGEITFNLISNDPEIANQTIPARNFKVSYTAKTDNISKRASSETTIKYLTRDLFTLKYIKNDDTYAIKSDEVINKYLAFENNNLKELVKKFGVEDVTSVPDKIENIDFKELLYISEQDKETILQKYVQVINSQIPKTAYTKRKNVNITVKDNQVTANAYTMKLTSEQVTNLKRSILETLINDDFTLDILLSKANMLSMNIDVNTLKTNIQEIINNLEESSNNGDVQITVYESNKELVRTEYSDSNGNITIDFTKSGNAKAILITNDYEIVKENETIENTNTIDDGFTSIEDLNNNTVDNNTDNIDNSFNSSINTDSSIKLKTIEIAKEEKDNNTEQVVIFTANVDDKIVKIAVQSKTNNDLSNGTIENKVIMNLNISDETYFTTNVTQSINIANDVDVEELNGTNSAKVNDFTTDYTIQLTNAIISRLQQLLQQKVQLVTIVQQQENEQQANQTMQNEPNAGETNNNQ